MYISQTSDALLANMTPIQCGSDVYFKIVKPIPAGSELLVFVHSNMYSSEIRLPQVHTVKTDSKLKIRPLSQLKQCEQQKSCSSNLSRPINYFASACNKKGPSDTIACLRPVTCDHYGNPFTHLQYKPTKLTLHFVSCRKHSAHKVSSTGLAFQLQNILLSLFSRT